ncbi:protocatechuate 3,4-dioxygenase subunit alpha [Emticicia sp. SJ17W-69]|uniref:protocatechuate 3,4-dioxygenase subunit alpha n=1 Tax=Emticicia sp. SJ17W-69 TaxID=3421657 RepID=UPI003EB8A4D6
MLQTPSQTVGPFFAYGLTARQYGYDFSSILDDLLIKPETEGERIYINGKIFDGNGLAIPDAMIELYQEDLLRLNNKQGFGRLGTGTSSDISFTFTTVKPQAIDGQAPNINVILFMRGSLRHLYTRLYFSDETEANQQDSLLNAIPEERRNTLIAYKKIVNGQVFYEFNITMQGEGETVFFDL